MLNNTLVPFKRLNVALILGLSDMRRKCLLNQTVQNKHFIVRVEDVSEKLVEKMMDDLATLTATYMVLVMCTVVHILYILFLVFQIFNG